MRAGALILSLLILAAPAAAELRSVPSQYSSIQAAIDAAQPGDRIELAPGRYTEILQLKGGVELRGGGLDPSEVVLDGETRHRLGRLVDDTSLLLIENLTLSRGWDEHGGGFYVENARLELRNLRFEGCGSMLEGGAIFSRNSDLRIEFCVFLSCYSLGAEGAALYMEGAGPVDGQPFLRNNTFFGTSLCCGNASIGMQNIAPEFENNILERLWCGPGADPLLTCNLGSFCGRDGGGHILADPRFCDWDNGDLHVKSFSPCLPENNGCGELIGALGICEEQAATQELSFSQLKARYR